MPLQGDGEPVACAVCAGQDTRTLYVKSGYAIGRCVRCGLTYANPRAPRATILARYSSRYFWDEYLPSLGVIDGAYDLTRFDERHGTVLRMLAARVRGRRLLEVGCGAGFFLKAAERAGWHVSGIELSEEASQFGTEQLRLDIRRARAEEMSVAPATFDAAAMFDAIEHLFDPRAVLTALARALAPGGALVISTPNFNSASRFLLGPDWAVLSPLEHVYYFTEDSLRRLLLATGFSVVEFVRRNPMWGPAETINFRYTHAPGSRRPRLCEALVRAGGFPLARTLQALGRQDTLLCFAQKAV